ncbi:hypothetical protein B0H11DRAFT_2085483 [Mycena galericulata]|nr:hypothetical protein B0H11DRAFT_2085483 [Mycena galericulata]
MASTPAALYEIQSPIQGRKSSPVGAPRPLDPTPIVQLSFQSPTGEVSYRHISSIYPATSNLWCQVELFRVPDRQPVPPPLGGYTEWTHYAPQGMDENQNPIFGLVRTRLRPRNVEADFGNHLILSGTAEGHLLLGNRTVQAHIHPQNDHIIFVFPHMGVLQTGHYVLRYRVSAHTNQSSHPIASRFGEPFTITTGAHFPGLQPSTPLTTMLMPLNIAGLHGRR